MMNIKFIFALGLRFFYLNEKNITFDVRCGFLKPCVLQAAASLPFMFTGEQSSLLQEKFQKEKNLNKKEIRCF